LLALAINQPMRLIASVIDTRTPAVSLLFMIRLVIELAFTNPQT
jgi:hypothetical protein